MSPPIPDPAPRWRLSRGEVGWIVLFWLLLAALTAANRILDPRGPGLSQGLPVYPIAVALFESALWAALTPGVFWLASRLGADGRRAPRVVLALAAGVVAAVAVDLASDWFRIEVLHAPWRRRDGVSLVRSVTRLWFLNDLVVFWSVLAAGLAREYFHRYRARQEEAARLGAQAAELQRQLAEARLEALRMQLDPHFLFNTLHAVSSLVERDPRGVRRMISRLSELLRRSLDGAGEPEVSLERELDFLRGYLDIMEVRFQGRLEVSIDAPAELLQARVPNLILQPLVENAIKHGAERIDGVARVAIEARRDDGGLRLVVRDNGPGLAATPPEGVGLRNVRERLRQTYGDSAGLEIESLDGGGAEARIRLPLSTAGELRTSAVEER